MIKVLDNVYDLVTLNMEQRFSERVALRFYDKETDEVTAVHYKTTRGTSAVRSTTSRAPSRISRAKRSAC